PDFDVRAFLGLLRRQARLIVATVFVVCALTALVLFQLTPTYTATALVMVDPRQQSILDPDGRMALGGGDYGRVESEAAILGSPSVLLAVARDLDLVHDPSFGPSPGWRDTIETILG